MRAVIQRASSASVRVDRMEISAIGPGFVVLLGIATTDTSSDVQRLAAKILKLRAFEDDSGRMNIDLAGAHGEVLCVSQFTLHADLRRGNRPSFDRAAKREVAEPLYDQFCDAIEAAGIPCKRGRFGAEMSLELVNDGPLTLLLDTEDFDRPRRA